MYGQRNRNRIQTKKPYAPTPKTKLNKKIHKIVNRFPSSFSIKLFYLLVYIVNLSH